MIKKEKKSKFGVEIIISIYIALKPLYLSASGTMQLCDMFLMAAVVFLMMYYRSKLAFPRDAKNVLLFFLVTLLYQAVVNCCWSLALQQSLIKNCLYYVFNFIMFTCCVVIYHDVGLIKIKKAIVDGCFLSLIVNSIGMLQGLGRNRLIGFFNNPNQLGYYGVVVLTLFFVCTDDYKSIKHILIIGLSIWAVIMSASKAAFISMVIFLGAYMILNKKDQSIKSMIKKMILMLLIAFAVYAFLFMDWEFLRDTQIGYLKQRIINMASENDTSLGDGRGYNRVFEMGSYFLTGMGEGAYTRFISLSGKEVHSTYVNLFVSYGLIGFIAYGSLFFNFINEKGHVRRNLVLLIGVLLYSVTHNGIRNTLLWVLFALFFIEKLEHSRLLRNKQRIQTRRIEGNTGVLRSL